MPLLRFVCAKVLDCRLDVLRTRGPDARSPMQRWPLVVLSAALLRGVREASLCEKGPGLSWWRPAPQQHRLGWAKRVARTRLAFTVASGFGTIFALRVDVCGAVEMFFHMILSASGWHSSDESVCGTITALVILRWLCVMGVPTQYALVLAAVLAGEAEGAFGFSDSESSDSDSSDKTFNPTRYVGTFPTECTTDAAHVGRCACSHDAWTSTSDDMSEDDTSSPQPTFNPSDHVGVFPHTTPIPTDSHTCPTHNRDSSTTPHTAEGTDALCDSSAHSSTDDYDGPHPSWPDPLDPRITVVDETTTITPTTERDATENSRAHACTCACSHGTCSSPTDMFEDGAGTDSDSSPQRPFNAADHVGMFPRTSPDPTDSAKLVSDLHGDDSDATAGSYPSCDSVNDSTVRFASPRRSKKMRKRRSARSRGGANNVSAAERIAELNAPGAVEHLLKQLCCDMHSRGDDSGNSPAL